MKKAYLSILLIALLPSPTRSETNFQRLFFNQNKYTTKSIKNNASSNKSKARIIASMVSGVVTTGLGVWLTIHNHNRYQDDFYNTHFNQNASYDNNQYRYNRPWQSELLPTHFNQNVTPYRSTIYNDSSENELDVSYHNQPSPRDNLLESEPAFIQHNQELQEKINNMPFIKALSIINTPLSKDNQEWALDQCMASLQAIKNMNTYTFEPDDKFAHINIIQRLNKLIKLSKLKYDYYRSTLKNIKDTLIRGYSKTGFNTQEDRTIMHNKIKHMIYAFSKYPKEEYNDIASCLSALFDATKNCKEAWEQVLNQLIDPLAKRCDCSSCTKYRTVEPFLTSDIANTVHNELMKIGKDIKRKSFILALDLGDSDTQQVHSVNYYAKQLSKLGIPYNKDDEYIDVGGTNKDIDKVTSDFLKIYKTQLVETVKDKLSYNSENTSTDFRDKVTTWLRALLQEKVKEDNIYKNMQSKELPQWVADFYPSLIWDDSYKAREQFVYFLLHTFGLILWDAGCYTTHPKSKEGSVKANFTISTLNSLRNNIFPDKFNLVKECKESIKLKYRLASKKIYSELAFLTNVMNQRSSMRWGY